MEVVLSVPMESTTPGRGELLRLALLSEGGLAGLALVLGWFGEVPVWDYIAWNGAAIGWGVVVSLPMFLLFILCLHWPHGPLGSIRRFAEEIIQPLFGACTLVDLALICTLAGFGEELLFRGVLQPLLASWLGWWAGLLLASLLFGLAHPITPMYVVLATLMGLYLGWAWLASENLLTVIVAHAVYDFVALVWLTRFGPPAPTNKYPAHDHVPGR